MNHRYFNRTFQIYSALFSGAALLFLSACGGGESNKPILTNRAPVIVELTASSTEAFNGETITLSATATDADNDVLTYTYEPSGSFVCQEGLTSAMVTVTDGKGGSDSQSIGLSCYLNISEVTDYLVSNLNLTALTNGGSVDSQTLDFSATASNGTRLGFVYDSSTDFSSHNNISAQGIAGSAQRVISIAKTTDHLNLPTSFEPAQDLLLISQQSSVNNVCINITADETQAGALSNINQVGSYQFEGIDLENSTLNFQGESYSFAVSSAGVVDLATLASQVYSNDGATGIEKTLNGQEINSAGKLNDVCDVSLLINSFTESDPEPDPNTNPTISIDSVDYSVMLADEMTPRDIGQVMVSFTVDDVDEGADNLITTGTISSAALDLSTDLVLVDGKLQGSLIGFADSDDVVVSLMVMDSESGTASQQAALVQIDLNEAPSCSDVQTVQDYDYGFNSGSVELINLDNCDDPESDLVSASDNYLNTYVAGAYSQKVVISDLYDAPLEYTISGTVTASPGSSVINYDIVYVRYPRRGDTTAVELPDAENPYAIEPGADLMLLHPDGSEEFLVDCRVEGQEPVDGGEANCSVQDPVISFDGKWVYYSKYVDMGIIASGELTSAWRRLTAHSFIYKIQLNIPANERQEIQITNLGDGFATDKFTGNGASDAVTEFGIRDLGPTPLPDGRLLFTSNREAIVAFRQGVRNSVSRVSASTVSQIYIMDDHLGSSPNKNLHLVGHSNLHQVQHPTVLKDGRILFTNWDDAGLREEYATATLYVDDPDGGRLNQFLEPHHFHKRVEHFATEVSSGDVIVSSYYPKMASWGYGMLLRAPVVIEGPNFVGGLSTEFERRYFSRKNTDVVTPHTVSSHAGPADQSGRYSTPSTAPSDGMLVSYSNGPVSFNPPCDCAEFPRLDAGIYLIENAGTNVITAPASQLILIKNDPNYNEMWPRAVIPYQDVHGVSAPSLIRPTEEYAPTDRDRGLVKGSPVGLTGTSSMQNRESAPIGRDRFNAVHGKDSSDKGWAVQGTDAGLVTNDDLWGVRILVMTPDRYHAPWTPSTIEREEGLLRDTRSSQHIKGYFNHMSENWKILGEFPVRNSEGLDDPDGEEDTSWLAKIPADTPHLIQSIDDKGMTLSTEQTWRHVRSGETFASCGGCHAHSKEGVEFNNKWADRVSYQPWDLVNKTPMLQVDNEGATEVVDRGTVGLWGVEFRRDILPILQNKCASCHTTANNQAPANDAHLAMFDSTMSGFEAEVRTYRSIALDNSEEFTHGTEIPTNHTEYYTPQKSRYVRALQSRASYLSWKIYDARLDGRANEDLPGSASISSEDLDYTSGDCVSSTVLTNDEKGLITRWIDLGAPINLDRPRMRYTDDALVPSMTMEMELKADGKVQLRIGVTDIESGIDYGNSQVEVTPTGSDKIIVNFSDITFDPLSGVGLYTLNVLASQVTAMLPFQVDVVAQDNAGNRQRIKKTVEILIPE